MPNNKTHTPLVCNQVDDWILEILRESAFWDLPDFDGAVFRSACNEVVIVWAPLNI